MALTLEQIAAAVVRDCKQRRRLANFEIRRRRSELTGAWLRSTPWFLRDYQTLEAQAVLYKKIEVEIFRLTAPKKKHAYSVHDRGPTPHNDPRQPKLI